MEESLLDDEIINRAKRLFEGKGQGALKYAEQTFEDMKKTGYEEDLVYWQGIISQIELLIEENTPG